MRLTQFSEAVQHYTTAINLNQNQGLYYYERAKAYYMQNDYNTARKDVITTQVKGYAGNSNFITLLNTN
jgi:tetratricopeptide (TPR) repeat protein